MEDNLREHRRGARRGKGQGRKLIKDVIKLVTTAGNFHGAHTSLRVSHPRREGAGVFVHPLPSVMFKGRYRRTSDLRNRGHEHWGAQNKRCQVFLSMGRRSALDYRRSLFCGNSAYTVCASGIHLAICEKP